MIRARYVLITVVLFLQGVSMGHVSSATLSVTWAHVAVALVQLVVRRVLHLAAQHQVVRRQRVLEGLVALILVVGHRLRAILSPVLQRVI